MQVNLKIFKTPKIDIASTEVTWGNGMEVRWIIIDYGFRKKKKNSHHFFVVLE